MRLALYQPDIAQNAGTMIRLGACLDVAVDIIEPCGFPFDDKKFRRAGMDYLVQAEIMRHRSWDVFRAQAQAQKSRIVLLTTKADMTYINFSFEKNDILLLGRESSGVPDEVHAAVDCRVRVPMHAAARSLNVAVTAAMVMGEAMRQTGHWDRRQDGEGEYERRAQTSAESGAMQHG